MTRDDDARSTEYRVSRQGNADIPVCPQPKNYRCSPAEDEVRVRCIARELSRLRSGR